MKKDIHPEYQVTTVKCVCGNEFQTRSTAKEISVEICSACHPFFTGQQKLIDSAGRVDRFLKKYGKDYASSPEAPKEEPKAEAAPSETEAAPPETKAAPPETEAAPPETEAAKAETKAVKAEKKKPAAASEEAKAEEAPESEEAEESEATADDAK